VPGRDVRDHRRVMIGSDAERVGGSAARVLACVIADVRGYTRFTRERGDAAAAVLAQRFADYARDVVEARGGEVIELRGDEVFAVFDSTRQAVRAAVELQLLCAEETEADPAFPLLIGIGIDTGTAVPVEDGYRGVAINLAARLCSAAGAGQVLLGENSARLAGYGADRDDTEIEFVARTPLSLKGFDDPVPIVEATAIVSAFSIDETPSRLTFPAELTIQMPMSGRVRELRWLRGTWRQVRRGKGRVVIVSGESGMGKTRLLAELAAQIDASGAAVKYVGPGGTAAATALAALHDVTAAKAPTLLVLDDADLVSGPVVEVIESAWSELAQRPALIAILIPDIATRVDLARLAERVDRSGDGYRRLQPLAPSEVRQIVELYAGESISDAPLESIERGSARVPGAVHELASSWARSEATRRLEAAAEFMTVVRDRRSTDLHFANNVIGLKLGRLYSAPDDTASTDSDGDGDGACPYKGLAAFEAADARSFFGRERLVGELAARVVGNGALAVVGASGSGKSSVISAGLLPSLQAGLLPGSDRWDIVQLRPGSHPLQALRSALDDSSQDPLGAAVAAVTEGGRLVVVIDQFEETFTLCVDESERASFLDMLAEVATQHPDRIAIVVALRSDFYGHLAPYSKLAGLMTDNHVLGGPLMRGELQRIIELPARRAGVRMEAALVEALVAEAADEAGALPLLSTALVELWRLRDDGWIRTSAYETSGGIRGAVARLAEASYDALDQAERSAARRVLLRLASADGDAVTRRRVRLVEFDLDRDPAAGAVIRRLTRDRLLVTANGSIEVAHEALLREWPRLRQWLDEDGQGRQLHQHLTVASYGWDERGRESSELYRGARLSATLDWSTEHAADLNELEADFLTASRQESERDAAESRRSNRRLRGLLTGVALLLVLAVIAGVVAFAQRSSARQSATAAQRSATQALGDTLGAQAVSDPRLDEALLEAREALRLDPSERTEADLLKTLLRAPAAVHTYRRESSARLDNILVSPDGSLVALVDGDDHVDIENAATGETVHSLTTPDGAEFGPDGSLLDPAIGGAKGLIGLNLLDPRTGKVRRVLRIPSRYLRETTTAQTGLIPSAINFPPISFDRAGNRIALGLYSRDKTKLDYVLQLGYPDGRIVGPTIRVRRGDTFPHPEYSADGRRIVISQGTVEDPTGSAQSTLVYDARTGHVLHSYPSGSDVSSLSPDGKTLAYIDGLTVKFLDLGSGQVATGTGAPGRGPNVIDYTPDGTKVVTSGEGGTVVVWNSVSHQAQQVFDGDASGSNNVIGEAISSDSSTVYIASFDGSATAWDLTQRRGFIPTFEAAPDTDPSRGYWSMSVSPDGSTVAVGSTDGYVHLWNTSTLRQADSFHAGHGAVSAVAYTPDGRSLFVSVNGATGRSYVREWNISGSKPVATRTFRAGLALVFWLAVSPDGSRVAAEGLNAAQLRFANATQGKTPRGFLVEWSTSSGHLVASPLLVQKGAPSQIAFAPHGDRLALGGSSATFEIVDPMASVGHQIIRQTVSLQGYINSVAYSPDGRTIAAADLSGGIVLYNATTGEVERRVLVGPSPIYAVGWSPDGEALVTVDQQDNVQFLDPTTYRLIGTSYPLSNGITTGAGQFETSFPYLQFSPDSKSVYVTDRTGRVWRLPVTVSAWEADACHVVGQPFTRTEWSTVAPGQTYQPGCPA
jgi:WD40 repeat protein/class 3 adenylate cyclase